jgi:hypothetical protein
MFLLPGNRWPNAQRTDLSTLSQFTRERTFSLLLGDVNLFVQTGLSARILTEGITTW